MAAFRPPIGIEQGRKSGYLRRIAQRVDPISETAQFADHSSGALSPRPLVYGRTSFLITHAAVQDDPDQPTQPVGNGPDGLLVSQTRHQPTIHNLEDASFGLDRSIGTLIENPSHVTVSLRGAMALGNSRT